MSARYLLFPPGRRNVWIPVASRRTASAGLSLVTFSRPLPVAAQLALWVATRLAGPWILPGRRRTWQPPVDGWEQLTKSIGEAAGSFDGYAVYRRPQAARTGVAVLLLHGGTPVGLLKIREQNEELNREVTALGAFAAGGCGGRFRVPRVLARGSAGDLAWLVISPMEPVPSRPADPASAHALATEISERLEGVLPRPPDTPRHWRPMHGDLTPWNLRLTRGPLPWLIDWEDAAYGPPGADEVYFTATRAAVRRDTAAQSESDHQEAVAFWSALVRERADTEDGADRELARRMLTILGGMRRTSPGA